MANKRIKGITIEIGADSTGLDKALKGVESGANKAKDELREVDRALKNAPESAVLWAQKQELLTKALEESRKKVDLLRDAQDQVNRQFQEGKISEEQYRAFQREVEKAEADVQRLTGELEKSKDGMKKMSENSDDAAEALEKTGESAEETGGKLDKISGIAVAAGAALAGAAKGAYESWKEVDEGYDTIIQKTGVTGENLKEFQSIADEIFTNLPVEMSDVGTAIGEVNTRFQVTDDLLKTISEDFLIYAQLNGRDVNSSIDNVSASMKAFDIEAEQAGKVLDTLTAVGQSTGVDLAQLESVLLANSATFKEMDLSIGESIQLLGQFEINGVDTATALAGLKKAQQNATAEGKTMSEALNDNISKIKNAKTETEALQIATDLFGKKGAAAMTQAISEGRFELETLSSDMNVFSGITKTTFEATLDAPDKLKVTLNNLKLEGAELAEKVMPKIEKGADYLVKNFPKIENTLHKSLPLVKGIGAGFVAWKAINTVSKGISIVKDLDAALKGGNTAMQALNSTMLANPAVAVGTAIIGVTTAVSEYLKTCEPYRSEIEKDTDEIKKQTDEINKNRDAFKEKMDAAYEAADADLAQLDRAEALWKELDTLADSTGKVKDKDKERAEYILNELNTALDTEYEMTGNQIQKYDELRNSIEKVIEMKKANILLDAAESGYTEAITNIGAKEQEQVELAKEIENQKKAIEEILSNERYFTISGQQLTIEDIRQSNVEGTIYNLNDGMGTTLSELVTKLDETEKKFDANEEFLRDYYRTIHNYEKAETAFINENYEEVSDILDNKSRDFIKHSDIIEKDFTERKKVLENQLSDLTIQYTQMQERYKEGAAGVTQEMVDELFDMKVKAQIELDELNKSFETSIYKVQSLSDTLNQRISTVKTNVRNTLDGYLIQRLFAVNFKKQDNNIASSLLSEMLNIPKHATGGYISGSSVGKGIVAEAGPELLEIINGGVKITPLSDTARNTAVGGGGTVVNNYNTFHVQKMDKDTDIYTVSEKLSRITTESLRGKGLK